MGDCLGLLSGHDHRLAAERRQTLTVEPSHAAVGDQEPPSAHRSRPERFSPEQSRSDVDGVIARGASRPQQPRGRIEALGSLKDLGKTVRALVRNDDVGELVIERLAIGVQALERGPIGGQRPPAALTARPGSVDINVNPDHQMVGQSGAYRRRADRAPAEGEDPRSLVPTRAEEFQGQLLLGSPEGRLAVLGEDPSNRLAESLLDDAVNVHRGGAESPGDAGCGG